jgi:DNA helicase HerA-like ATPase
MSIERSIIARSQPHVVAATAKRLIEVEASKGCEGNIVSYPVALEPKYSLTNQWIDDYQVVEADNFSKPVPKIKLTQVYNCWLPPEHALEWFRAESFLKILKGARDRICFEIIGNSNNINFEFNITECDSDILKVAFNGECPNCEITSSEQIEKYCGNIFFNDYYPLPPYHHLFTRSTELLTSAFEPLIYAYNKISNESKGFVQVLFEPVRNNWHCNVELLNDIEYLSKTVNDPRSSARIKQQLPSGDIRNMARDVETKAHNDKPFYAVAIRAGIITNQNEYDISGLTSFMNLFQHGGSSLKYLTHSDYEKILSSDEIKNMFNDYLTYRPGFLLNSSELSGIVHLPSMKDFSEKSIPINFLENPLTIPNNETTKEGIRIGYSNYAGERTPVHIPVQIRKTSTHLIGKSGSGKSTLMENMILQDISLDEGVAVLDPHGDTIKKLLKLIPQQKIEDTIYIDFGNPDWIPIWNPLKRTAHHDLGRTANDLVSSFKKIIKSNAWGDRLEHLLRNGISGLLLLEDSTMYDLLILFEQTKLPSKEKNLLVDAISRLVTNPVSKRFWNKDFQSYRRDDFAPPHHKLSKLLNTEETVSLMLTQPDNFIDFQNIIEEGKILLIDVSNIGSESREILGSYLLTLLHNYSLSRSRFNPEKRKPFNIYCDEAHKITTDAIEDMIIESRKFGVNLTLAHQYLSQFNTAQRDALLSMGSTIIFNTNLFDAQILSRELKGKVEAKELAILEVGEAIAKVGTDIFKISTETPKEIVEKHFAEEIIKNSHSQYYRQIDEVKRRIKIKLKEFYSIEYELKENLLTENPSRFEFEYDEFE